MLIVKSRQMRALGLTLQEDFARKCLQALKDRCPGGFEEIGVKEQDELSIVFKALDDIKKYGIHLENDVSCYLDCIIYLGVDFDKKERWVIEILNNAALTGEDMMNIVHETLVFTSIYKND